MDIEAVEKSYARWAPIYDRTFGAATSAGRRQAVSYLNDLGGSVLEVGVGTGMALPYYRPEMNVTGIDFSADMLARAQAKVRSLDLGHVCALLQMDARDMEFADDSFDAVAAMHVLSVVPEPECVMAEIARVCKPGGKVVIANHFRRDSGLLARLERITAPFADTIGWHSDFDIDAVLGEDSLALEERRPLPPFGMMTFLVLVKKPGNRPV